MLALLRGISFRHWTASPFRSLLVVVGITLGVALYVATVSTSRSMLGAFDEIVERVSGRADLTIEAVGVGVPNELVADVAEVEGVAHAAAMLELTTQAPDLGEALLVLGVDLLGDLHFLPFDVQEGEERVVEDPLAFVNDASAILVSRTLATRHGLEEGSELRLLTSQGPKVFVVRGIVADDGPTASFGGRVAVMFLDAAQIAFARGTFADRIDVAIEEGADAGRVRERLEEVVGPRYTIERPERVGARLRDLSEPLRAALWLSGFVALLVSVFIIYNAVGIAVAQRRKEIGLLRALGVTRARIVLLFCVEAALLSVPGAALGLVLASRLSAYSTAQTLETIDRLYVAMAPSEALLDASLALQGLLAGLLVAVLAAVFPAWRGAQTDPALALRSAGLRVDAATLPYRRLGIAGAACLLLAGLPASRSGVAWGSVAAVLITAGAALVTPAAVVLTRRAFVATAERLLGLPARLALDNVERTLGRSAVNVMALLVAVSMTVSVGGWLASFERSVAAWFEEVTAADLAVTAGSPILDRHHLALDPEAVETVAALPEVAAVQPFRMVDQQVGDHQIRLVATDTRTFLSLAGERGKAWDVVRGEAPVGPGELAGQPRVALSENAANRLGLGPGDTFSLVAPRGPVELTVRAVIVDYSSEKGAVFIDRGFFLEHWGDDAVDAMSVYLRDGVDGAAAADAVRAALGPEGGVFVTETAELRRQLLDTLTRTFAYSRSVELIALVIALLGVASTMAAAVLDRVRELGMLRAIGATRRQVGLSVVVEAGFLGFCAVTAGIALGTYECLLFLRTLLFRDTGWHLDFVFPLESALRIGSLVVFTSALAGLLPALRAARTDVTAALSYE